MSGSRPVGSSLGPVEKGKPLGSREVPTAKTPRVRTGGLAQGLADGDAGLGEVDLAVGVPWPHAAIPRSRTVVTVGTSLLITPHLRTESGRTEPGARSLSPRTRPCS